MKKMKKVMALLLSLVMVLAMTSSVLAATITINGGASDSEYAAYKLLSATVDANDSTKVSYKVETVYESILKSVTGQSTEAQIIEYISKLTSDQTRTFADKVYAEIKAAKISATAEIKATDANTFNDVEKGYYLIAETKTSTSDKSDTYSLVMLNTVRGDAFSINTKEDKPKLEKKVQDKNDSKGETSVWQDSADADVGDEIDYRLTGTVSSLIGDYKTYYYEFHDTMTHLTYVDDSARVTIGNADVTSYFTIVWDKNSKILTAACIDLKKISGVKVDASTTVVVTYKAILDSDAILGSKGNPNTAYLEFNNNPYYDGNGKPGETGKTPEDTNIVFTYKTIINKTDGTNPLSGAEFSLEKFVVDENATESYENVNGKWVQKACTTNTEGTTFTFSGLDDGYYRLKETKHPDGYNPISDIYFEITATHDVLSDNPALTDLSGTKKTGEINFTKNVNEGSLTSDVVNHAGSELPSTGGMGTTIFYVVGSILVLGAAILLITKKRMSAR